jgi:hypothetical protein
MGTPVMNNSKVIKEPRKNIFVRDLRLIQTSDSIPSLTNQIKNHLDSTIWDSSQCDDCECWTQCQCECWSQCECQCNS